LKVHKEARKNEEKENESQPNLKNKKNKNFRLKDTIEKK
jgi:hypothetical protein